MTGKYRYEWCASNYGCSKGYYVRVYKKYGKICLYSFLVSEQPHQTPKQTIETAIENLKDLFSLA